MQEYFDASYQGYGWCTLETYSPALLLIDYGSGIEFSSKCDGRCFTVIKGLEGFSDSDLLEEFETSRAQSNGLDGSCLYQVGKELCIGAAGFDAKCNFLHHVLRHEEFVIDGGQNLKSQPATV